MDGFVKKFKKEGCFRYLISPKTKFDFAEHFGITNNGQLNPPLGIVANTNPPASNPSSGDANAKSMEGMEGSNFKNSKKIKNNPIYIKKEKEQTLQTLQPSIIDEPAPTGSAWDTETDDDDPYWG